MFLAIIFRLFLPNYLPPSTSMVLIPFIINCIHFYQVVSGPCELKAEVSLALGAKEERAQTGAVKYMPS